MIKTSNEYALALFSLARETDSLIEILNALQNVRAVILQEPAYLDFLASPDIPKQARLDAIAQAFSEFPEYVVSFLQLLTEHGQIRDLINCIDSYIQLYNESNRIAQAEVISAVALTEAQTNALRIKLEKISGCRVQLVCRCDETLLGGLVVRIDGKVLDGSLRRKLSDMKEVMYQ